MSTVQNYYERLGIDSTATLGTIREAFARLRSRIPEEKRRTSNPQYQKLVEAYEVLSDPELRANYDGRLAQGASVQLDVVVQSSADEMHLLNTVQTFYLLVEIRPPQQKAKTYYPLNLCIVVDKSTSMREGRLDRVKAAVNLIINQLAPEDRVSVISFSDRAEVVVPSTHIQNIQVLTAKISSIQASGGTEIYQGLAAGVQQIEKVILSQHVNHLILLTDGHTYGDVNQCLELARETALRGIGFTAFGIGSEWNDQFLDKLVAPSSGQSGYIESPEQTLPVLQSRIRGLGNIYAQNLRLKQNFPPELSLQFGFKLTPFAQPLTITKDEIQLGTIEGRSPLTFLLEMNLQPQNQEKQIDIPLRFVAENPAAQNQEFTITHQFILPVKIEAKKPSPTHLLIKAVRMLNMYRMNERVWQEVEAGHLDAATKRMRHLTTRLLEAGETQLAQHASVETERLSKMGTLSLEGRKRLKYGTRSLISQTMRLDDAEPGDTS